ncbi:hypothetical protein Acr_00g0006830 [Actinidia rufa]|uniref:Uncharacterized protein n=1 Tax=Actinidia rufa TaxID=165716 RepID=A0A7J0D9Y5_9ERIC|nr:hypothetical protein Acr_00g0006830 [Actinidia rufa]
MNYDRRENRVEVEKTDVQRSNWRSENRRNNREAEQHQHQHPHHTRGEAVIAETWRKPAEQPKPPLLMLRNSVMSERRSQPGWSDAFFSTDGSNLKVTD